MISDVFCSVQGAQFGHCSKDYEIIRDNKDVVNNIFIALLDFKKQGKF